MAFIYFIHVRANEITKYVETLNETIKYGIKLCLLFYCVYCKGKKKEKKWGKIFKLYTVHVIW